MAQGEGRKNFRSICDKNKASCEACFLMGSVDIVLPSHADLAIA